LKLVWKPRAGFRGCAEDAKGRVVAPDRVGHPGDRVEQKCSPLNSVIENGLEPFTPPPARSAESGRRARFGFFGQITEFKGRMSCSTRSPGCPTRSGATTRPFASSAATSKTKPEAFQTSFKG